MRRIEEPGERPDWCQLENGLPVTCWGCRHFMRNDFGVPYCTNPPEEEDEDE